MRDKTASTKHNSTGKRPWSKFRNRELHPKKLIFLSIDAIGSTKLKSSFIQEGSTPDIWAEYFTAFLPEVAVVYQNKLIEIINNQCRSTCKKPCVPELGKEEASGHTVNLWKYIGDEVVLVAKLTCPKYHASDLVSVTVLPYTNPMPQKSQKLYETEEKPKRALLVSLSKEGDGGKELRGLSETLELAVASHEMINVRERQPKFGMGSGKAAELAEKAKASQADCIVFDWDISPSQQRNWEELAGIPVLDRQELIIQIFSARAATREADLQVQLAELNYRLPRLAHKYIDLSRQRGGRYGTKGSGETQLEADRRKIEQRIHKLEKEIEEVSKQRQVQRRQRERQGLPVCAIVGYTNAGKSSLLNALTGASVLVEDKLFATLDATTRRFEPAPGKPVLLTDTVGFIRRLPHSLIKAFRSTLEEASRANLLIHVLDASDPAIEECYKTTISVLSELGAGEIPVITVLNKADKLDDAAQVESKFPDGVAVSAKSGFGLDELKRRMVSVTEHAEKPAL